MSKFNRSNKNDKYIERCTVYKKWIVECACCGRKGYNPNMPNRIMADEIGNSGTVFIRNNFRPLKLNEYGLCEVCEKALKNRTNKEQV